MKNLSLLNKLLDYYQISLEEYHYLTRPISFSDIPSENNFQDINEAVNLVKSHMENNDKIIIYGDYDADGICGASILMKMFQKVKYNADYYIPSRYIDGYGLNLENAQKIYEKNYRLVITVDNGISANTAIEFLRDKGVDVLVIDHHEKQDKLPPANYIIHPILSNYSSISSSGAFTAFMFSKAFLGYYDKYLSTLAAISLISDMMPLIGYNRDLLRIVTKNYKIGEFPNIDHLLDGKPFNDTNIGLEIAPKINAIGRVSKNKDVNRMVRYLISDDPIIISSYKKWILYMNDLRKNLSKQAQLYIDETIKNVEKEPAIVAQIDIADGLLGLVANSLLNKYQKTALVMTTDSINNDFYKGSARSVKGVDLASIFTQLSDLEETYGGHALAAGVTIKKDNYDTFKNAFLNLVSKTPLIEEEEKSIEISLNDLNESTYQLIETFSPFGEAWKAPLFSLNHIRVSSLAYSSNKQHIMTYVGLNTRLVGFNHSKDELDKFTYIDITGQIRQNYFKGKKYYDFLIQDIKSSK